MRSRLTPISFTDDDGVRWTVETPVPADESAEPTLTFSGPTRIDFLSETGERRSYTVLAMEPRAWGSVNELAWRILLRRIRTEHITGAFPRVESGNESEGPGGSDQAVG